jgi:uncharacterized protein
MLKFLALSCLSFLFLVSFQFKKEATNQLNHTNSLLWKIEGNGLKFASYLFGTMHLIQKEYYYFPRELEKIVKKTDLLLTEINLNELDNQIEALKMMTLKEGSLVDFFSQIQKDSLLTWAKDKLMMDEKAFLATFGKFKPFIIIQTATQLAFFGKTESYELSLKSLADKHKITMGGLETMKQQLSFFDDMTREEQAQMVMESISDEAKMIDEMNSLQRAYKGQYLDSLEFLMKKDKGMLAKHEEILLTNRNMAWIPKIQEHITEKSCFIAVGAAHLIGEKGLIQLLKNKGYQVSAVKI